MKRIFVVDDEANIRKLIKAYLDKEGYQVEVFDQGDTALEAFRIMEPDMLILDIMMPGINGFDLCKEIRKTSQVPIIIVSAKDEELDRILGLELGSDDYLSKPFSPRELVVRVKNIFKRVEVMSAGTETSTKEELAIGNTLVDVEGRKVSVKGLEVSFTGKEFDLLSMLFKYKGQALSRDQILDAVWGYEYVGETRLVDDVIKRIRKKLGQSGSDVEVATVWGYGYKIGT